MVFRGQHAPIGRLLLEDHLPNRLLRIDFFELYQETKLRKGPEHLLQGWYPYFGCSEWIRAPAVRRKCRTGVERGESWQRDLTKQGVTAGGTIESGVVKHDRNAVGRESHVQLDGIRTLLHRQPKRGQGILRG